MASTLRRSINPLDSVKPAGRGYVGRDEGVQYCMVMPAEDKAASDSHTFSHTSEVGARVRHYGYRNDPTHADRVHGRVSRNEEGSVAELFRGRDPAAEELAERREKSLYASVKRAPIGTTSAAPMTVLPETTKQPGFAFGASSGRAADAKFSIFPESAPAAELDAEKLYEKSHRSYAPGVQRSHGLNWAATGIDPAKHTFGRKATAAASSSDAVAESLHPDRADSPSAPRIIPKAAADYMLVRGEPLGTTRGRAALDTTKHPPVYGRPSAKMTAGEWGVADCLRGDYTQDEQLPDPDLGKSIGALAVGHRRAPPVLPEPERRFGMPSIRTDVPPRTIQSVASTTDFGSAPGAAMLLSPSPYAEHGVDEKDFVVPRTREDLASIFAAIGYMLSPEDVDAIYARAAATQRLTPPGSVSVEEFRRVLDELIEARELGEPVAWL